MVATHDLTTPRPAGPPRASASVEPVEAARPSAKRSPWLVATAVFAGSFVFRFLTLEWSNDHFRVVSQGRQVLVHGEAPFRDFADPGIFLQIYASAAAQALLGYSLLGEALLSLLFMSLGAALTCVLATRASGSLPVGLVLTIFAVAMHPRLYQYHVLVLPLLGLLALWAYLDRRTVPRLVTVGLATALAFLFRHDQGIYLLVAVVPTLLAAHWGDGRRLLAQRLGLYGAVVAIAIAPFFLFLQANGGVLEYFRSAAEYVRSEARRQDTHVPTFVIDPMAPLAALVEPANALPWLYYALLALPPLTIVALILKRVRRRAPSGHLPFEAPKILAAALLCLVAQRALLRDPESSYRLADVAGPTAVLAAWLLGQWLVGRRPRTPAPGRRDGDPIGPTKLAPTLAGTSGLAWAIPALVLLGITWASIVQVAELGPRSERAALTAGPVAAAGRAAELLGELRASPPIDARPRVLGAGGRALARYVHDCTRPTDRLLVTWFAPELYFFSGRGFSGKQLFWFTEYYASPREQDESVKALERDSVPIVIMRSDSGKFSSSFEDVHAYILRNYRLAREGRFGGNIEEMYRVFVNRRTARSGEYRPLSLPCYK
jgi:hypothetical protein